jgi:multidrug efflux pump
VIEDQISGIEGITTLKSSSADERADIVVEFSLSRDVNEAANDVRDRISRVVEDLPVEADPPDIAKVDNSSRPVMWLSFTSDRHTTLELTDIAERTLIDRLSVVEGVARVRIGGSRRYAMRIWLDREALAARELTVNDVVAALRRENVELPAGRLESLEREFSLRTRTGMETAQDFRDLVIARSPDGRLVRLGNVARVEKGAENERTEARTNTLAAISLGVEQQSKANTVQVTRGVLDTIDSILPSLPEGVDISVNFARATFIEASMVEVVKAIAFALTLVLIVIYLFLGNLRATLVPAVTVPVSVIAAFIVMALFGYSINTLMLLGLVLAIGLVVDDAIVVLENIYRRVEQGGPALLAALSGSREIGFAVVATTLVLIAVFLPISFLEGNIGRLFGEFGVAVAAAVAISSLVALTLVPMLCSKLFSRARDAGRHKGYAGLLDRNFERVSGAYGRILDGIVRNPWPTIVLALAVSFLAAGLFRALPAEYGPKEDRGVFFVSMGAPPGASLEYTSRYARLMEDVLMEGVEAGEIRRVLIRVPGSYGSTGEVNSARAIALLENWANRSRSAEEIASDVRTRLAEFPGVRFRVATPQGLGVRGDSRPVQMVLGGGDYAQINAWADAIIARTNAENPGLTNIDSDYDETKPRMAVSVDRNRAAVLGVSLENIGRTLETMLGSRIVTTYIDRGLEYNVVLQAEPDSRASPKDLSNIHVRSELTGQLVPLGNLVTLSEGAGPSDLRRFDRMRAITLSAGLAPGYPLGDGIDYLESLAEDILPADARVSWDGESREFLESGSSLYLTFALALVIVFLVLAAQFESFRHPMVIMMTVPLAVTGALGGLWLSGGSINVYSQIGLIMLVGLAAKNGVLIVEFANQLRDRGMAFADAVVKAASIRLRPILMTSTCTAFGALPLLLAEGAGAESRQAIGTVIVYGVAFSSLLTLFVVPAMYAVLARGTTSPEHVSKMIDRLQEERGEDAGTGQSSGSPSGAPA